MAAKDTLAHVFGGLVVILDKPFSIGDWIKTPSVEGTVEDITFPQYQGEDLCPGSGDRAQRHPGQ
ncbi:MAG: mechanosensitive ion channel domain-containing protein [Bacillota bacterium]